MRKKCEATIPSHDGWRSYPCGTNAKVERDGKHFCGVHDPKRAPTKAQKIAKLKYDAQRVNWDMLKALGDAFEILAHDHPNHPAVERVQALRAKIDAIHAEIRALESPPPDAVSGPPHS